MGKRNQREITVSPQAIECGRVVLSEWLATGAAVPGGDVLTEIEFLAKLYRTMAAAMANNQSATSTDRSKPSAKAIDEAWALIADWHYEVIDESTSELVEALWKIFLADLNTHA